MTAPERLLFLSLWTALGAEAGNRNVFAVNRTLQDLEIPYAQAAEWFRDWDRRGWWKRRPGVLLATYREGTFTLEGAAEVLYQAAVQFKAMEAGTDPAGAGAP